MSQNINSRVWTSLRSRLEALINEYDESVSIKKRNIVKKITGDQQFAILSCSLRRKRTQFYIRNTLFPAKC